MAHPIPEYFRSFDENVPFFHPCPRRPFDTNLGVVDDEVLNFLDMDPMPHEALESDHDGPAVLASTELDVMLDQHSFGCDNLHELYITVQASQPVMNKVWGITRQVLIQNDARVCSTAQVHRRVQSKYFIALSGQALKQNASLAHLEMQTRIREREFVALAAYTVFPHKHVTVYPPVTALVSSDASNFNTKIPEPISELEAENRIRKSKGLPPLTPKLSKNAQRRENKRLARQIVQGEDVKYAHLEQAWKDLGTTKSGSSSEDDSNLESSRLEEPELAPRETPMGHEFIQSRALCTYELPPPVEFFERWLDEVEEDSRLHRNSGYARNEFHRHSTTAPPKGAQENLSNAFDQLRALPQAIEDTLDWALGADHYRRIFLQSPNPGRREI